MYLLFEAPPTLKLPGFVNNLKTVSSRRLRREFETTIKEYYGEDKALWERSYCLVSAEGAPADVLRAYIEGREG